MFSRFFLHEFFSVWAVKKRKQTFYCFKIVFFSNCQLKKKLFVKIILWFRIWDWWNHLMNSLKDWTQIYTHTISWKSQELENVFFGLQKFIPMHGPRTHDGWIPNSVRPKFKSQINIWDWDMKGLFFVEIMVVKWKTWTRDSM